MHKQLKPVNEGDSPAKSNHDQKVSLGAAIKLLHQELHNINFTVG